MPTRPHIVIVGGGFAGLAAAKALASAPADITLIDKSNHHLFQPLLYQVATAALSAPDIAAPIRQILAKQDNVRVVMDRVQGVELDEQRVICANGDHHYDHLILAAGAVNQWFGQDRWAAHAPGLKTLEDALDIRRRVLLAFEAAEREAHPGKQQEWLTFAVVGAGPTGTELAGSLSEIARHTMARNFRRVDPAKARVVLVDGADRVLTAMPEALSASAKTQLERLGVEVQLGKRVKDITADRIVFDDGTELRARTVLWGAGVAASPLGRALGVETDRSGRVLVGADLSLEAHPEVYVVGDMAHVKQEDGALVPGVAPAATQAGQHAARCILARMEGRPTEPFRYADKGSLATIGRRSAVADFGRLQFSGAFAWVLWLFVHLLFLVGFRNRIAVLFDWFMAYVTWQRSARVIVDRPVAALPAPEEPPSG